MKFFGILQPLSCGISFLLAFSSSGGLEAQTNLTYLGNLGAPQVYEGRNYYQPIPSGINNSGEVVGTAYPYVPDAFTYSSGTQIGLIEPNPYNESYGNAINSSGEVVGSLSVEQASGVEVAYYDVNGSVTPITSESNPSDAYGVNDSGEVVGSASTSVFSGAFSYVNGTLTSLGTLGGHSTTATNSIAYGINNTGTIVGTALTSANTLHAFSYANGTMSDLGTLGGQTSTAYAINNNGQIVGSAALANGNTHAFLLSNGIMTDLGTLGGSFSSADALNSKGDIVGIASTSSGADDAFFYSPTGGMQDLNAMAASFLVAGGTGSPAGFTNFFSASGINDDGDIIGQGSYWTGSSYQDDGFLLTDVPEPTIGAQMLLGLLGLVLFRWHSTRKAPAISLL